MTRMGDKPSHHIAGNVTGHLTVTTIHKRFPAGEVSDVSSHHGQECRTEYASLVPSN